MNNYDYQREANISCFLEDEDYVERKNAFLKLIHIFRKNEINFALACSCNLFLRGIVDDFHDFDLIVDINDAEKIECIMKEMGAKLVATGGNGFCESEKYYHYQLQRVDVDIIAGFKVKTFGNEYLYRYKDSEIEYLTIHEKEPITVPLISLEALFILYSMMEGWQQKRRYKRILIQTALTESKILKFNEVFEDALENQVLPGWIERNLRTLLSK